MQKNNQTWITIGEVAHRAGVPQSTIRYYTEADLLRREHRTPDDKIYRYPPKTVERVRTIRLLRELTLSTKEIKVFLDSRDPVERRKILERNRLEVLHNLTRLISQLLGLQSRLELLGDLE